MDYSDLGFIKSPYDISDALLVEDKLLVWDRPDLPDVRSKLDYFIKDLLDGRRVGLKIFGPTGSGKTWLTRLIQKEINEKAKETNKRFAYIYTYIPKIEPQFSTIYRMAIENFLQNDFNVLTKYVEQKTGSTNPGSWEKVLKHDVLIKIFARISSNWDSKDLAIKWIYGERLSASELTKLQINYSLDGDYKRFTLLRDLLHEISVVFDSVIFVVDELENAPAKTSEAIGDSLRTLLDSFSVKFALIATFTAEKEDEWYDMGYTEQFSRRFNYAARLDSVKTNSVSSFIKDHNKLYYEHPEKIPDHLHPFKENALTELLRLMSPEYHYPGFILPNCNILCFELFKENGKIIDDEFVRKHQSALSFQ